MISFLKSKAQGFWNIGHERTIKIKRNIIYSFLIKGTSVLVGFMLIPLTIHYINPFQYGIWLTISSLVAWMNTFDIGLSNGLRNKLAHSLALGEKENIIKYVSTTYAILFLIALITFVLFFTIGSFFNWNHLLNINSIRSIVYTIFITTN
jgi:O-antigen/teichoic acid export membrane protein